MIKLLFPELLDNTNQHKINNYLDELYFLYERAMELRKTVDNQLKIINPNDNTDKPLPRINSSLKKVMFNIKDPFICTAHRCFINHQNGKIEKIALDLMGIEQNKREATVLKKREIPHELYETTLIYNIQLTRSNFINSWDPFQKPSTFNFLTGESEIFDKESEKVIIAHSFYDLI